MRTSTVPPFGPGTEPRTSIRLSLLMISTISRPFWVTRLLPIWPGPRMPFITRAGQADAPIDPGARTLCEPWDFGPRLKLWRLIVPWKPLPFEVPATLTVWPVSKVSTVTVSPTVQLAGLVAELHQVAVRGGVGLLQVAELGLRQLLLTADAERELHGLVAVALERADCGDGTGTGLQDGDALDAPVLQEALGHPELLGEDRRHLSWPA